MHVLVTGGAGFIGSHLVERLLTEGAKVRVIDNLSTGRAENLAPFRERIEFISADLLDDDARRRAVEGVEVIFHEAAIASVPRSVATPVESHLNGAHATLLLLESARQHRVRRLVFAASSSAYGEKEILPKDEAMIPDPVSPYAATKVACEYYLRAFARCYDLDTVSLRYFNIFGPRQDPSSPYSGVIARFCRSFVDDQALTIFGDGEQSRDFTYVTNAVEANWRAATAAGRLDGEVLNVGCGERVTLNRMLDTLNDLTGQRRRAAYAPSRAGDVRHSLADLRRIRERLGYRPIVSFKEGLAKTLEWYKAIAG
jgi:UDP-glucose 4-epimerase